MSIMNFFRKLAPALHFISAIISGLFLLLWIELYNEFSPINQGFDFKLISSIIILVSLPVVFLFLGFKAIQGKKWAQITAPIFIICLIIFILLSFGGKIDFII